MPFRWLSHAIFDGKPFHSRKSFTLKCKDSGHWLTLQHGLASYINSSPYRCPFTLFGYPAMHYANLAWQIKCLITPMTQFIVLLPKVSSFQSGLEHLAHYLCHSYSCSVILCFSSWPIASQFFFTTFTIWTWPWFSSLCNGLFTKAPAIIWTTLQKNTSSS